MNKGKRIRISEDEFSWLLKESRNVPNSYLTVVFGLGSVAIELQGDGSQNWALSLLLQHRQVEFIAYDEAESDTNDEK